MARKLIAASFITKEQEFQLLQAKDAEATGGRVGYEVHTDFADGKTMNQISQIFEHINAPPDERPAAIIIEAVAGGAYERIAQQAAGAGIGWIVLNSEPAYLHDLRRDHPDVPVASVTTDQMEVGRIQGAQFKALLPEGGTLLYIQGSFGTEAASGRLRGMEEIVKGSGIRSHTAISDWTEQGAENAVTSFLKLQASANFKADLIGCQNDSQAVGARRAIQRLRPDWHRILYTGVDGLPDSGQKMVRAGILAATVIQPPAAGPAVELIARFFTGDRPQPPRVTLDPRSFPEISELGNR